MLTAKVGFLSNHPTLKKTAVIAARTGLALGTSLGIYLIGREITNTSTGKPFNTGFESFFIGISVGFGKLNLSSLKWTALLTLVAGTLALPYTLLFTTVIAPVIKEFKEAFTQKKIEINYSSLV